VTGRYGTIGEVFYVTEDFWPLNTTLFVSDFKGNNPKYIEYLLRTIDYAAYSGKSGVPGVNRNDLHEIAVRLPPECEQRSIALALSDADALLGGLDRIIAKKRNIKHAAMQQILTGNRRLEGFREGLWNRCTISGLISENGGSIQTGPFGTLLKASEYATEGLCVVSVGEIGPGILRIGANTPRVPRAVVQRLPEYVLRQGDIVFGRKGAVDRSALVCSDGLFLGSDAIRLRLPRSCHPPFIAFQLQTHSVRTWLSQHAIGTTMASLNHEILMRVSFLLPPTLQEQVAVSTVLSDMDAEIAALERRRDKTRLLKQGMMQELLTGRIRLA
jgi:type I restriction enzyme S subunit